MEQPPRDALHYLELFARVDRVRNWMLARALYAIGSGSSDEATEEEIRSIMASLPESVSADEARRRMAVEAVDLEPVDPLALQVAVDRLMRSDREESRPLAVARLASALEVDLPTLEEWMTGRTPLGGERAARIRPLVRRVLESQDEFV